MNKAGRVREGYIPTRYLHDCVRIGDFDPENAYNPADDATPSFPFAPTPAVIDTENNGSVCSTDKYFAHNNKK